MKKACSNCTAFHIPQQTAAQGPVLLNSKQPDGSPKVGECRRHPPKAHVSHVQVNTPMGPGIQTQTLSVFPPVQDNQWCETGFMPIYIPTEKPEDAQHPLFPKKTDG